MVKEKEEMFSTNLRMPKHLQHKINVLSNSDDRSFNGYILKVLQESVTEFEQNLLDSVGTIEFTELYLKMFGSDCLPYIKTDYVEFEPEQIKVIAQNIIRGKIRTINNIRQSTDESMKIINEFLNDDKTPTE